MQKLSVVTGLAAILAALALLYLWPRISGRCRTTTGALVIAAVIYAGIWVILCYIVAVGMYLIGMW